MKPRLTPVSELSLHAEQQAILDKIAASRAGNLNGPFHAWIRNPEFADLAQALGKYCRYDSHLSLRQSELLIVVTAAFWNSQAEWAIHAPIAESAGVCPRAIEKIRTGITPNFRQDDERLLHIVAKTLLEQKQLPDDLYTEALAYFGEAHMVDIVGIIGYYSMVALTLNAFDIRVTPALA